jgi:shikimate 5-dehydrogenase
MADALDGKADIEDYSTGADAVQIVVPPLPGADVPGGHANLGFELAGDITRAIASIRRNTVIPIIAHIALPPRLDEETKALYISLISHTFRCAPEMVTLDLRLEDHELLPLLEAKGRSKIICDYSFSNANDAPSWSSPVWESMYKRAVRLGSDMVRFLRPALCLEDNFAVSKLRGYLESVSGRQIPVIAHNTGALGRNSACFNPILTMVEREENNSASRDPAILSARAASLALSASFIYDPMQLYVFGANVSYSMSPAMHNSALAVCGMPHQYQPYSTNTMSGLRHLIEDPHFGGASVGLPFKVEIISLTHSLSKHAQAIGAVNTLIPVRQLDQNGYVPQGAQFLNSINRAGPVKALFGENTDWIGIRACIRRGLSPANAVRKGTCGLVIGAGGMARAALYAMLQVGVQNIAIYNRTVSRAEQAANHFQQLLHKEDFQTLGAGRHTKFRIIKSLDEPWPADFNLPTMIISCIPTHRIGDVPAPDFRAPDEWLSSRSGGVIIELGYKSLDTPLLAQAKSRASQGWVAMDGLDLLPDQGFAQFELFTGRRAPRRIMRRDLLKAYAAAHGKQEREEMGPRLGSLNEPEA